MITTITHVHTIAVTVTDQDEALRFYTDVLGFETRLDAAISDTMRWIEVAPPGATTTIALVAGDTSTAGSDTGIRLAVTDAASTYAAMGAKGVAVDELLVWDDVPPMFIFKDPDANQFYAVEGQP